MNMNSLNDEKNNNELGLTWIFGDGEGGGGGAVMGAEEVVLKKGPWTAAEDAVLIDYVKKYGGGKWNAVLRNTGLARCGKSCRLRWTNHLRPNLKKGAFSPKEEKLIVDLHAQYGNKWARMATLVSVHTRVNVATTLVLGLIYESLVCIIYVLPLLLKYRT